jgi:hypothetical protein
MALMPRAAHVLQWERQGACQAARPSESHKLSPSSDCGLQLARMKPESLVIADQNAAVNVFLSLVHTARQATKTGSVRSRRSLQRQAPKTRPVMGTKS